MSKTKYAQKILHFYCYTCKDYELKTSPHYAAQKRKFAARRKAEAEGKKWPAYGRSAARFVLVALTIPLSAGSKR